MATAQFNKDQQIFLCTDANPKRAGSVAHCMFQHYFKSRTVGEFLAYGGSREAVLWDAKHGFILLDWDAGVSAPTSVSVDATAPKVTQVRAGVKRSKAVADVPATKERKVANFFKAAEEAKLAGAIAANSGVRMENLIVRVVK
jgi:hypothetical protein